MSPPTAGTPSGSPAAPLAQGSVKGSLPAVRFLLHCEGQVGDRIFVAGSHDDLGQWNPDGSKVELRREGGPRPLWRAEWVPAASMAALRLEEYIADFRQTPRFRISESEEEASSLRFKFVVRRADGSLRWEDSLSDRMLQAASAGYVDVIAEFDRVEASWNQAAGDFRSMPSAAWARVHAPFPQVPYEFLTPVSLKARPWTAAEMQAPAGAQAEAAAKAKAAATAQAEAAAKAMAKAKVEEAAAAAAAAEAAAKAKAEEEARWAQAQQLKRRQPLEEEEFSALAASVNQEPPLSSWTAAVELDGSCHCIGQCCCLDPAFRPTPSGAAAVQVVPPTMENAAPVEAEAAAAAEEAALVSALATPPVSRLWSPRSAVWIPSDEVAAPEAEAPTPAAERAVLGNAGCSGECSPPKPFQGEAGGANSPLHLDLASVGRAAQAVALVKEQQMMQEKPMKQGTLQDSRSTLSVAGSSQSSDSTASSPERSFQDVLVALGAQKIEPVVSQLLGVTSVEDLCILADATLEELNTIASTMTTPMQRLTIKKTLKSSEHVLSMTSHRY